MRKIQKLKEDWRFIRGDFTPRTPADGWGGAKGKAFYFGMTEAGLDTSSWEKVTLPHDFILEGDYSSREEEFIGGDRVPDMTSISSRLFTAGSLPGGIGWYRKTFRTEDIGEGRKYYLYFDGVYRSSTVYLNEHFVGQHESGYTGFFWDVTDYIYTDRENVLAVRVDARGHEGWWYEGGGIYRPVSLLTTDPVHLSDSGVFVQAEPEPDIENGTASAKVRIQITLENALDDRPVTMALVFWDPQGNRVKGEIPPEELLPLVKELDLAGFNYWQQYWDPIHRLVPEKPLMNTEASSGAWTRSCYETCTADGSYYALDPKNGDKRIRNGSNAVTHPAEESWMAYCRHPFLSSGYYIWTAFDYRGEPSPMPYPAISSQFGLMDTCGFDKDMAFFFRSWWQNEPVLHIFPHWNRQGLEGQPVAVYVFGNASEVELSVNGKSLGKKEMPENGFLSWENVIYEPGELAAVGMWNRHGREAQTVRKAIRTTGPAAKIQLTPWKDTISMGGEETGIINIALLDEEGNPVPTAENRLEFHLEGKGEFLGAGNGNPGDHASDRLPVRNAFHGLCQLHVRPTGQGVISVTVYGEGLGKAGCQIHVSD